MYSNTPLEEIIIYYFIYEMKFIIIFDLYNEIRRFQNIFKKLVIFMVLVKYGLFNECK